MVAPITAASAGHPYVERPAEQPRRMAPLHLLGYVFPFVLLAGGYFLFPVLRYRISDLAAIPPEEARLLPWILIGELVFAFAWLIIDFLIISSNRSSGQQVLWNMLVSSLISSAMLVLAGAMFALGEFAWWLLIPTIAAFVDDLIITNRGGVNLWQKPFAPTRGST